MRAKFLFSFLAALPFLSAQQPSNTYRPLNSFEQGHQLKKSQMPAAYNAPDRITTRGSWDVYLTTDYLFWQPLEENLEVSIPTLSSFTGGWPQGKMTNMHFKYKSGFKVGLGVCSGWDNWDGFAEYTRFCGRHSCHVTAPKGGSLIPLWGTFSNMPEQISSGKSRWRLSLQFIDANLGRTYYVGKNLTFRSFFGARAAWIDQKYIVTYVPSLAEMTLPAYENRQTTRSWGVGPEAGLVANWLVGYGFRFIGSVEGDILYTQYKLRIKEQNALDNSTFSNNLKQFPYHVRPHTDLQLGLGWGSYFSNHNAHCDFSATYGFQVFWDQNMFRTFGGAFRGNTSAPNGNLYTQGLTVQARLDF